MLFNEPSFCGAMSSAHQQATVRRRSWLAIASAFARFRPGLRRTICITVLMLVWFCYVRAAAHSQALICRVKYLEFQRVGPSAAMSNM
jgi:hypothetical protein